METGTRTRQQDLIIGAVLLAILALAAGLRLYLIGGQSLWADEMSSLVTALKPVPQLLYDISNEIHPPLYHLMLKGWIAAFGTTEAGIRSMSALFGIALVGLTYALGERLFNRRIGLLAAALSAVAPFQVYHSQEARMYMPLAAISAVAVYAFARFVEAEDSDGGEANPGGRPWVWAAVYVAANGLGLWTHYSYPIILAMENALYGLWLLLTWRQGSWLRRGLRWVLLQALAVAIYLPWLPLGYRQLSTWPAISQSYDLSFILQEAFRLFALGESVDAQAAGWVVLAFTAIFAVGLLPVGLAPRPGHSRKLAVTHYLLAACYVLFPILMMYGLSLLRPAYRPKFFLVGSPAFCIILARGILGPWSWLGRWGRGRRLAGAWAVACVALMLAGVSASLTNYYFVPRYARDDYRGIAQYVAALEKPGQAVLLNAPGQKDVFGYYYRGGLPVYPLPRQRPVNAEQTVEELERIAAEHDKLYAVFWATDESDPQRVVEGWLDRHAYKALDTWRGNARLVIYSLPRAAGAAGVQRPMDAAFGDQIALTGYSLPAGAVSAGDILPLSLTWKALKPVSERYSVFVHLLDGANHIVGQRDAEPGGGGRPTNTWKEGEEVADNYGILIRPGTPSGRYAVELGLYRLDDGGRLPVTRGPETGADRLLLPAIEIRPPDAPLPLDAFGIQHPLTYNLPGLDLLGYDLYRLGHEDQTVVAPGEAAHLNLYWQAGRPLPNMDLTLRLVDGEGRARVEEQRPMGGAASPAATWSVGEVVRDQYDIPLGPDVTPGRYTVEIRVPADGAGGDGTLIRLGSLEVG